MGSDLDFNRMYAIYVAISFFPLKTALTNKKRGRKLPALI